MKTEKDFDNLIAYIKNWNEIDGIKPCNEETFIKEFLNLINNYPDEMEVTFDGEGAYFGKQVTLEPFSYYGRPPIDLRFEVAYSKTLLKVYSANHNGFWYPEFLSIEKGKDEHNVIGQFYDFLKLIFGL